MWQTSFLSDLNTIIDSIRNSGFSATENIFISYLSSLRSIGSYSKNIWNSEWRKKVYELGTLFEEDASRVLEIIRIEKANNGNFEALDFLYSEILWNFFEDKNTFVKDEIKRFIREYPGNPEFHHTYSHILEMNGNYKISILESQHALSQEKDNHDFIYTYTGKVKTYFEYLIDKNKIDDASDLLQNAKKYYESILPWQKSFVVRLNNTARLTSLEDRLSDHKTIQKQVINFSGLIDSKINREQRRLIEILGFFSAILAFILTNITIVFAAKFSVKDVLLVMFSMAILLLIFVISISYLFGRNTHNIGSLAFLRDGRFWSIILMLILLFFIFNYQ
ncbi:MAG: hypothetical protein Q7S61_00735 [bacterium]|nr:hypothetical protein [bacterium]